MSSKPVFRKVSLDRLASPEQLDQLLTVTDTRGWIVLAALGIVLLTGIIWGVTGSAPEDVTGMGILVKSGGVFEIVPSAGGRVSDLAVGVGDTVTEGQVVARVAQPELSDQLQTARVILDQLRTESRHLAEFGNHDITLQATYLAQQRAGIVQTIERQERTLGWLGEKIASQEQLVRDGLLTKPTLLTTRQQYDETRGGIDDARSTLTELDIKSLGIRNTRRSDLDGVRTRIEQQQLHIAELERTLKEKTEVVTPYTGRILETMAEPGGVVGAGEPILTLDLTGREVKDLVAILYVPSVHGKQIRPGMTIQIAPSTVKQEEYGRMIGRITYVSDFPATSKGMHRVLKNEKLTAALSGQDAPYEVHADLMVDPETTSRYKWSSSKGPPLRIQSGTLALGNITVATRRPIEMVIPLLRKYTGI